MIIVMDKGYATKPNQTPPQGGGAPAGGAGGISAFEEVMINEIIPMIDTNYRTKLTVSIEPWPAFQWEPIRPSRSP